jgi:protein ImuA
MNKARPIETTGKMDILRQLQNEILSLQGFKPASDQPVDLKLGPIAQAFPQHTFPTAALHEFLTTSPEDESAAGGFIAGLSGALMRGGGAAIWIGPERKIFPPALRQFGIDPERILFIQLKKEKEILAALEETLKCPALSAVIGELPALDFTISRRLQLAVEHSKATGFILRNASRLPNTTSCVARWRIRPLPSEPKDGLPGIGFPRWQVELLKIRNGRPGAWTVQWTSSGFHVETQQSISLDERQSKTA